MWVAAAIVASSTAMWFMFMVGSIVIFYESESGIASSRSIFMNQYDTIVCGKKYSDKSEYLMSRLDPLHVDCAVR